MLFNFELRPLNEVEPWGHPPAQHLSWFGLTDGWYWLETGDQVLYEYSVEARHAGTPRYFEYQVVRLYEDVMNQIAHILNPVPFHLACRLTPEATRLWRPVIGAWLAQPADAKNNDRMWDLAELSTGWRRARTVTSMAAGALHASMWSDEANVHISWSNTDPSWSASAGRHCMSRASFLADLTTFHQRLMDQMQTRVEAVLAGALPPHVHVDLHQLQQEHAWRTSTLERAMSTSVTEDWDTIKEATSAIEAWAGNSAPSLAPEQSPPCG